jgi:hypothetical protein
VFLPKEEIGMRAFVITTFALAVALAPAAAFAQSQPPTQQPPSQPPTTTTTGQPPATTTAQPPAAAPKVSFTTPAGVLLVQVKPDQTAVFEEMFSKLKTGVASSTTADLKAQAGAWKAYRASEPMAGNVLYIVLIDPAVPNAEYQFFEVMQKTLTDEQKRDPATAEMYKKYAGAIASMNKLNVTPVGGGQ